MTNSEAQCTRGSAEYSGERGTFIQRTLRLATLGVCFLFSTACMESRKSDATLSETQPALSPLGDRVLGFETPVQDWSSPQTAVSQADVVSQGTHSLSFYLNGYTQLRSANVDSLGNVDGQLSYDIYLPSAFAWGDTRVAVHAPSLGLYERDVGGRSLQGLAAGSFHTVSITLPSDVAQALRGTYTDLSVRITVNGPPSSASPVLLDRIVFGGTSSGGGGDPEPGEVQQVTLSYPAHVAREKMLLSATDVLRFSERVELSTIARKTNIAALGPGGITFSGAGAIGHTDVYSRGPISLSSQVEINGLLRSEGDITLQDNSVVVRGAIEEDADVPFHTFGWPVQFPSEVTALPTLNHGSVDVAPGAYDQIKANGGEFHLRSGVYYVDDFATESGSMVYAHTNSGPVVIYVRDTWTYRGPISVDGPEGSVLVAWLGTGVAPIKAPFVGAVVAPNGEIELQRPDQGQHKGSFFGKAIEVHSDCRVIPLPFDWGSIPNGPNDPDNDGLPWPYDQCPRDPSKTKKGICGCGVSEKDSDDDGTPDCIEFCDDDPSNTSVGSCGCVGSETLAAEGVPCSPESCSGRSSIPGECDGAGRCVGTGPLGQCRPELPGSEGDEGTCVEKQYRTGVYWFCTGAVDWEQAEATCNSEPGRHLVRIDSQSEGQWLSAQIPSGYWVGGNDLTTDGEWFWSGPTTRNGRQFWTGGAEGERYQTRIANFAPNNPGEGDCLTLGTDGQWVSTECAEVAGFICEQPKRFPLPPRDSNPCDFFPDCEEEEEEEPGPCVDIATQGFPDTEEEAAQIQEDCSAQCRTPADLPCSECTGFATPPAEGESCDPFSSKERSRCMLEQGAAGFDPTRACDSSADCNTDERCGVYYECTVPETSGALVSCANDADCPAGQFCGTAAPYCMVPDIVSPCGIKDGNDCVARCFEGRACGQVHERCAVNDDPDLLSRCNEVEVCSTDHIVVPADLMENPNTDLTPVPFAETDFFPEELPEGPGAYESAKPDGCGGEGEAPCQFAMGEHPWCSYAGEVLKPAAPIGVSDDSDAIGDKRGQGGNSILSFDFDPNLDLNYDLLNYDPLGEGDFDLSAEASARASATFDLLGVEGTVNILDALGRVAAGRCGFEGDAYLKLFGVDFLPAVTCGDTFAGLEEFAADGDFQTECSQANKDLLELLARAKKALRDAQELIRQYRDLEAQGKRFVNELCDQLLGGRDLPPAFQFEGCDGVTPEQVIGYFVNYYRHEVAKLVERYEDVLYKETAGRLPKFDFPIYLGESSPPAGGGSTCDDGPNRETQQIVNVNFAIGPIPMNLTIEAFLEYGVNGELLFSLDTSAIAKALLPAAGEPDGKNDLASATLTLRPGATAGIIMFVGAGFDAGPVAAKIGISGEVTLADVELPAYGGVSLMVESVMDDRPPPSDFLGMVPSYTLLFPSAVPQRLRLNAGYRFGMEAHIKDLLRGTIYGKLRIKFFFFSKTWQKKILEFNSPFANPEPIILIQGEDSATIAEGDTPLAMFQIPVPFPNLEEIIGIDLPPYDPRQFDGVRSLATEEEVDPNDPRYVDFDPSRVEQLLYDGYCAEPPVTCVPQGETCTDESTCCGSPAVVTFDGLDSVLSRFDRNIPRVLLGEGVRVGLSSERQCVHPNTQTTGTCERCASEEDSCTTSADCCNDGYSDLLCYSDPMVPGTKACQECRTPGFAAVPGADANGDGIEDGGCCEGLIVLHRPNSLPVCRYCGGDADLCAEDADCCGSRTCLESGRCSTIVK
jgi:hypothetical protein